MNGWAPKQVIKEGLAAFGANQAATPITKEFAITAGGASSALAIVVKASGVAANCTLSFQTGVDSFWENVTSGLLTNGYNVLRFNMPTDSGAMPFLAKGRLLISTDATGACTIESVQVLQEL